MNIIIYTIPEVLEEKKDLATAYWSLPIKPKINLTPFESEIYFATKGFIRGKFNICEVNGQDIHFEPESWKPLKNPVPQKQFQNFKYLEEILE
jgi:hypothetical protein